MAFCSAVGGVVCTTVPAGPARVTWLIRPSCRLMFRQERPLPRSATRVRSRASQQIRTWARIRCSRRWKTGRSSIEVAEAAFGFQEVLVAQGGVFRADVRVGGGDEVLAVQAGFGLDLRGVDLQEAVGLLGQPPAEGRVVAQRALRAQVRRLVTS